MPKKVYIYNTETCNYELFKPKRRITFLKAFSFIITACAMAAGITYYMSLEYGTPKENKYQGMKEQLVSQIALMDYELDLLYTNLADISDRDDNIYRMILEAEPLTPVVRGAGAGGVDRYADVNASSLENKEDILKKYMRLDRVKRQMYVQTLSFDELLDLAVERNKLWSSIPSIQPVYNKELRRLSTVYGMRFHPILKIWRPHRGLDFMAPKNTPVYSTGNGKVKRVWHSKTFGKVIDIDHGYGYVTRYAHLNEFKVKRGDIVKRGQIVGLVGNTGLSVSDHLHYEVFKDGVNVNPIGFFQRELDDEAYAKLLELAKRETKPLD